MKKNFDLHRLSMVLRWDILTNWQRHLGATAGLAIGISLYCVLRLFSMRYWINSTDVELAGHQYQVSVCMFFSVVAFIAFYVLASCIFNNMKTKLQRESFLMLPACNLEKFVARLLMMSIGALVQLFAAVILADVIQFIFSFIITPDFHISITWAVLSHIIPIIQPFDNDWLKWITLYSFILFSHSFATLGGTFYRKLPVLLTACTGILLSMILGYIINKLGEAGVFDFFSHINFSNGSTADYCITITAFFVFLALAAFNYWASYKLFTRMQVICNKWINI
ncbi:MULTISPECIES: hypothetical protein [Prevotellaceae]|uniref:hypothetical protein n=1 Tax=Prevotellaceae TaxID=171552 RepID=UPI0011C3934E|nr:MULTISPECIES: hypothetical protein [Prevotellaceae]